MERVFSGAQRVITARRTRLEPEAAEAQTMGRCNRKFFDYLAERKKRARSSSSFVASSPVSKRARTAGSETVEGGEISGS